MKTRALGKVAIVLAMTSVWACETSNPNRPTMSFTAPLTQGPTNGVTFNFNQQPITLSIANVVRTGGGTVTYSIEVATTSSFANPVLTRENIAEGTAGATSVTLPELDGNTTYFWRWRAIVEGIAGEPSSTQNFFVRPNIVIQSPILSAPINNVAIFGGRPTFRVNNATRTGPAGTIFYEFQVSEQANFGSLIASATIQEQTNQTSWTPVNDLPEGVLFWRARATDPVNVVLSGFSNAASFERRFGIDLASVTYTNGHPNISTWEQTRRITSASHSGDQLCVFSEGAQWPAIPFLFGPEVDVEGNQYMFALLNGTWFGASGHWYRPGQTCKGEVDENFFVDAFTGPPFNTLVLHSGDVFGVALTTPSRAWPTSRSLDQRSDAVLVVW